MSKKAFPEAVIFDLDGVLIDSEPLHYEADSEIFQHLGLQIPEKERKMFVGMGSDGVFKWLKDHYSLSQSVEQLLEMDEYYRLSFFKKKDLKSIPGIPHFLEQLQQENIQMALASSSAQSYVYYILESIHLTHYFKCIATAGDVARTKPFPDLFLLAAQQLMADPLHCLVIEDSANGIKAARAAGMKCIHYRNPPVSSNSFPPADLVISRFDWLTMDALRKI